MAASLAIGVIGAGQVAERHVAAYRANPSTRVAVIIDPALERAQALAQTCDAAVATSYEEVLAHGGLDAVSVCVPHDLHFPFAQAATAAGVHMLMEKPIANTLEEADGIIEHVERSGVRLMIGFVHRFRTEVQEARRLLAEGAIGTPSTALDRFCSLGGPHPPAWVWRKQHAGGGVLMYGGIHAIDRLLWLLGTRVTSVAARWHHTYGDGDVEDGLVAMLDLANGATAVLFENSPPFGRPGGWCTELFGSAGAVRIQTGEWVELTANARRLRADSLDEMHFQREIDEFVSSVLEDREPSVPAAAGRDSLEVALAIYRSAAEGTRVDLGAATRAGAGVAGSVARALDGSRTKWLGYCSQLTIKEPQMVAKHASAVRGALSKRALDTSGSEESAFFKLLGLAEQRDDVITLGMGEPDIPTPSHIVAAAKRALDEGKTGYTAPAGMIPLREAISEKLKTDNDLSYDARSEVVVTTGAQEAIAVVMQSLLNPRDEVLIAAPYYQAYETNILLAGGVPVGIPTTLENDFQITAADVTDRITERTKLLAIVSPSNPTAAGLTRENLEELAEIARRHDLVVLSDELYEKVIYDDFEHVSIAGFEGMRDRTIVINGFSKAYSMTGFRVGYLAGPADYVRAALEPRHSLSISSPTPFQHAALAALTGPQDHFAPMMDEYTRRRDTMAKVFDELGVRYSLPRGAFYFWADISGAEIPSYDFCERAVRDHGLLFFPGSMYGPTGEGGARISFLAPQPKLDEALERFAALYRACQASA